MTSPQTVCQFIWIMARKSQNYSDIFARQKEQSLSSADQSRKGSIDSEIVNLVNYINASDRYFTTSSCSGRIIIFEEVNSCIRFCTGVKCNVYMNFGDDYLGCMEFSSKTFWSKNVSQLFQNNGGVGPKRGCRWFYTTHEQADFTQIVRSNNFLQFV